MKQSKTKLTQEEELSSLTQLLGELLPNETIADRITHLAMKENEKDVEHRSLYIAVSRAMLIKQVETMEYEAIKQHGNIPLILKAYKDSVDERGKLFKYVDQKFSAFLKMHKPRRNDYIRLLFFLDVLDSIKYNPNRFVKRPASSYGDLLHLSRRGKTLEQVLEESETKSLLELNMQEVKKVVQRKIELMLIPVESEVKSKKRFEKKIADMKKERKYLPNKKYTEEMFRKTDEYLPMSKGSQWACEQTLNDFKMNPDRWESYQKQYNKRNVSPKK